MAHNSGLTMGGDVHLLASVHPGIGKSRLAAQMLRRAGPSTETLPKARHHRRMLPPCREALWEGESDVSSRMSSSAGNLMALATAAASACGVAARSFHQVHSRRPVARGSVAVTIAQQFSGAPGGYLCGGSSASTCSGESRKWSRSRTSMQASETFSDEELLDSLYQRTLEALDFQVIVDHFREQCCTTRAKDRLDEDPLGFLMGSSLAEVKELYQAVEEISMLDDENLVLQKTLDIEEALQLADEGIPLDITMLSKVSRTIEDLLRLRNGLDAAAARGLPLERLSTYFEKIELPDELLDDMLHSFEEDEDELSGKKFPEIGQLQKDIVMCKLQSAQLILQVLNSGKYKSYLADDGYRQYGYHYVVSVRPEAVNQVGVVVDRANSGKTVYVEPYEVHDLTSKILTLEAELQTTTNRILSQMSAQVTACRFDLDRCIEAAAQIDAIRGRLFFGDDIEGEIPFVGDEGVIQARNARNPCLLVRSQSGDFSGRVVGGHVELGGRSPQGVMISGPNAGGKTVLLKTIGLMVILARCGIPVPAAESPRVDFFEIVLAEIGDMQAIVEDLSTYAAHLLASRVMLTYANIHGPSSLLLVDEAATGTDPMQGAAMARACLESYLSAGARVVATTHSSQLKNWAVEDNRLEVAAMEYVKGKPTFRMLSRQIGESHAFAAAERMRLPGDVIKRAEKLLGKDQQILLGLQRESEALKTELEARLEEVQEKEDLAMRLDAEAREREKRVLNDRMQLEERKAKLQAQIERKRSRMLQEHKLRMEDDMRKLQVVVEQLKTADAGSKIEITGSMEDLQVVVRKIDGEALEAKQNAKEMQDTLKPMSDNAKILPNDKVKILEGASKGQIGKVLRVMGSTPRVLRVMCMNGKIAQCKVSQAAMVFSRAAAEAEKVIVHKKYAL